MNFGAKSSFSLYSKPSLSNFKFLSVRLGLSPPARRACGSNFQNCNAYMVYMTRTLDR